MVAQDCERPHEGPTDGVQLGMGHVYLEPCERQTEFDPLKDGGV